MDELKQFVWHARQKGLSEEYIRRRLERAGWKDTDIDTALDDMPVPTPPYAPGVGHKIGRKAVWAEDPKERTDPFPVVQNLSVRGFEYKIMFLALWAVLVAVAVLCISFISDRYARASSGYEYGHSNSLNTFMLTMLIVMFPVFAYLFLRLRKAELTTPALHKDPSRRRLTQITQLLAFLFGLGFIIYFIFALINPDRDTASVTTMQVFWEAVVVILIAGPVFAYYWRDDHRK